MLVHLRRSFTMALICLVIFGFAYAFAGTGVAQLLFKFQANGSITANGSTLIGQNWTSPKFFHGRPDDFGPYAANAATNTAGGDNPLVANGFHGQSGATNLGPHSKVLLANTKKLVAYWHSMGVNPTPDLVTTSGSGYDPDISPQDALVQIPMVAKATGLSAATLTKLINSQTHGAQFGFLGASYIDVLQLNEALAKLT
ncbi:MAG: potassium-transporting ATPase subunit C [Acidobacteria bacterium]|nr:potassium-transporting ATPase subunit C [Acidobacteriota bacterium]